MKAFEIGTNREYMQSVSQSTKAIEPGTGNITIRRSVHPNDLGQMMAIRYIATHADGREWIFWADNPGAYLRSLGYTVDYSNG